MHSFHYRTETIAINESPSLPQKQSKGQYLFIHNRLNINRLQPSSHYKTTITLAECCDNPSPTLDYLKNHQNYLIILQTYSKFT